MQEQLIVSALENWLKNLNCITAQEVNLDSTSVNVKEMTQHLRKGPENQKRIDLLAFCKYDSTLLLFEAEQTLYLEHAHSYLGFGDYIFLVVGEDAIDEQPSNIVGQVFRGCQESGVGLISIQPDQQVRILSIPTRQDVQAAVREGWITRLKGRDDRLENYRTTPYWLTQEN